MEKLPENMKKITDKFLANMKEAFSDSLISVVMYGPAVRGEKSKEPYINFLVVVEDNTPSELARCSKFLKQWYKRLITVPLFLHPEYIGQSLDTFPLEFMEMSSSYHVVFGTDELDGLEYDASNVRNQCERELKGKLLHLRAEYLSLRGNKKGLMDLINRSLNTFRLLFSGALYLKNSDIPQKTGDIIDTVIEEYNLDTNLFKKLIAVAKGEIKVNETEADTLFDLYIEELDKLSNEINEMPSKDEEISE